MIAYIIIKYTRMSFCYFGLSANFRGGGARLRLEGRLRVAVVQTKPKAPDPIRTPKLSGFRHG